MKRAQASRAIGLAMAVSAGLAVLTPGHQALAHGMRTAYLELVELSRGSVMARWKLPIRAPGVGPRLPAGCRLVDLPGAGVAESPDLEGFAGELASGVLPVAGGGTTDGGRIAAGGGTTDGGRSAAGGRAPVGDRIAAGGGTTVGDRIAAGGGTTVADRIAAGGGTTVADRIAAAMGSGPGEAAFALHCDGPLAGMTVAIDGLGPLVSEGVVWASFSDHRSASHLLTPAAPDWELPETATKLGISSEYVGLGLRHILSGADHLLFLLLLVLTLKGTRAVIAAETAFTVSHSISFSATALGWLVVSSRAAEACIALSLVLLALDVERRNAAPVSLRSGAAMALIFGLVHGLGFAGGLREIGLPEKDAAFALVGFGMGVELGQIAFLLAMLALYQLVSRTRWRPRVALTLAYGAGGVASYWLIERLLTCFSLPG